MPATAAQNKFAQGLPAQNSAEHCFQCAAGGFNTVFFIALALANPDRNTTPNPPHHVSHTTIFTTTDRTPHTQRRPTNPWPRIDGRRFGYRVWEFGSSQSLMVHFSLMSRWSLKSWVWIKSISSDSGTFSESASIDYKINSSLIDANGMLYRAEEFTATKFIFIRTPMAKLTMRRFSSLTCLPLSQRTTIAGELHLKYCTVV